jgi:hypothetical protein
MVDPMRLNFAELRCSPGFNDAIYQIGQGRRPGRQFLSERQTTALVLVHRKSVSRGKQLKAGKIAPTKGQKLDFGDSRNRVQLFTYLSGDPEMLY